MYMTCLRFKCTMLAEVCEKRKNTHEGCYTCLTGEVMDKPSWKSKNYISLTKKLNALELGDRKKLRTSNVGTMKTYIYAFNQETEKRFKVFPAGLLSIEVERVA